LNRDFKDGVDTATAIACGATMLTGMLAGVFKAWVACVGIAVCTPKGVSDRALTVDIAGSLGREELINGFLI
jgi:hypothetical protein